MREVEEWMEQMGYTQERLAEIARVSQAQISRMLQSRVTWRSEALERLCLAARVPMYEEPDPTKSPILAGAIQQVWDGSSSQARAVAELLLAAKKVGGFRRRR